MSSSGTSPRLRRAADLEMGLQTPAPFALQSQQAGLRVFLPSGPAHPPPYHSDPHQKGGKLLGPDEGEKGAARVRRGREGPLLPRPRWAQESPASPGRGPRPGGLRPPPSARPDPSARLGPRPYGPGPPPAVPPQRPARPAALSLSRPAAVPRRPPARGRAPCGTAGSGSPRWLLSAAP